MAKADPYIQFQVRLENLKAGEAQAMVEMLSALQVKTVRALEKLGASEWTRERLISQLATYNDAMASFSLIEGLEKDGIEFVAKTQAYHQEALATTYSKATLAERLAEAERLGFNTGTPLYQSAKGPGLPVRYFEKDLDGTAKIGKFLVPRAGAIDLGHDTALQAEFLEYLAKTRGASLEDAQLVLRNILDNPFKAVRASDQALVTTFLDQRKTPWTSLRVFEGYSDTGRPVASIVLQDKALVKSMYSDFTKILPKFSDQKYIAVHKDIRSAAKAATREAILKEGFRQGTNVNALPLSTYTGKSTDMISRTYGRLKKDDVVYLLKKGGVIDGANGYRTKAGYTPKPEDVVLIEYDGQSLEEAWQHQQARLATPAGNNVSAAITPANMSPAAIYTAAVAEPMQGKLMSAWANQLKTKEAAAVSETLKQGWLAGQSVGQSVKDLQSVFVRSARDLATITRTFYQHLASETQRAVWDANKDIIDGIIWDATLDNRTTLEICAPRDQLKYTLKGEPVGHSYGWMGGPGQAHWNCRSTGIPWIKGHELDRVDRRALDAGKNYKEGDDLTRTGRVRKNNIRDREKGIFKQNTNVKPGTTYSDWLRSQGRNADGSYTKAGEAFIDDVLGKEKGKLFRAGKYKIGEKFSPLNPTRVKGFLPPAPSGVQRPSGSAYPPLPSKFVPAKTLKEASEYAQRHGLAKTADFGQLDLRVANEMNEALHNHVRDFPEFQGKMGFIGSTQVKKAKFVANAQAHYKNEIARLYPEFTPDKARREVQKLMDATQIPIIGNSWAVATPLSRHPFAGELNGLSFNERWGKPSSYARLQKSMIEGAEVDRWSGIAFHPPGVDSVKGLIDHELGHQMDFLTRAAKSSEGRDLWQTWKFAASPDGQTSAARLSTYAEKNIQEYFAEGWGEFRNSANPREEAQKIGEFLTGLYNAGKRYTLHPDE